MVVVMTVKVTLELRELQTRGDRRRGYQLEYRFTRTKYSVVMSLDPRDTNRILIAQGKDADGEAFINKRTGKLDRVVLGEGCDVAQPSRCSLPCSLRVTAPRRELAARFAAG
jgi:hypothetical protein